MKRISLAALAAVAALFTIVPALRAQALSAGAAAPQSLEDRRKALNDLFHEYWEDYLKHNPEFASEIGDKRYNDQTSDYSVRAVNDTLAREQNYLIRLAAIDSTGFTDQEKTSQELLIRRFETDEEASEFKTWEMPVNQMDGIYADYPQLVAELSFATVKDYDDWIARLHALPKAFEQVTDNMEIGIADHRVPPKYLLVKTLDQVKELANQKPEDSPLALPLKKFPASIPAAEQERIKTEMLAIAQKLGFKDLASFRASLKTNPKLHPTSAQQLLDAYQGYLKPMEAKLPELFGHLPKAPFEVVPVPDYLGKTSAPAYYEAGTPDGSRPGRLFIDTYDFEDRNLYSVEDIAYHEGIPGHHLQISMAQEIPGLPEFRRYGHYTAYTEGWGLYAERLGKDVGFYQDPYSDYGRLEGDIWRAIRLVVDTGVHSEGWTRQQMVDYFHEHSNVDEPSIQSEVDRYIAWPSQALAYKIGQLKILELRARAQKALGDKFDIRAFHDQVIDSGALPLDVLEQRIDGWIASQKGSAQ
ncbi:MAG: DUF885 domain-containing protein [Terracidiphilus sp.]